nr:hypothetical protein Itr_chr11CG13390 [Ipomoea trifida]
MNMERQEYQMKRNHAIKQANYLKQRAEKEALKRQEKELEKFRQMKEKASALENIKRKMTTS